MLAEPIMQILANPAPLAIRDFQNLFFEDHPLLFLLFAFRDVRANRDVLQGLPSRIKKRKDGGVHPVNASVLGAVANFAFPGLASRNGCPQISKEGLRMVSGINDAMILTNQLV